jgi:anaerobic ribonucleoside-triphosphate reductase activating protein
MNYAAIKPHDTADGYGVRVSLFVSGCTHHCKGCFNSEAWDFNYGTPYTQETENEIISLLNRDYIRGLSLLGGEPMEPQNQAVIVNLIKRVKQELPTKDIWCYSGYTLDKDLCDGGRAHTSVTDEILHNIDVLVDGRFVEELKDLTLKFRGSKNQRLIDVKNSLLSNSVVLIDN